MAAAFLALLAAPALGQTPTEDSSLALGLRLYRQGRCVEATAILRSELARRPYDLSLRRLIATCLLKQRLYEEARVEFEGILAQTPADGDAREGLRLAIFGLQQREQAHQDSVLQSRAVVAQELRSRHEFDEAERALKAGNREQAERLLRAVVARDPQFLIARQRLAELCSRLQRCGEAAALYTQLAEDDARNPEWMLRAAENHDWNEDAPQAIAAYRRYLTARPKDRAARLALARALSRFGLCHEALPELERVAQEAPRESAALVVLAQCLEELDEEERAIETYQRVLAMDPHNAVALAAKKRKARAFDELPRSKGYAALERGDFVAAAENFAAFLAAHPDSDDTLLELAQAFAWGQQYKEAAARFEEYLRRRPEDTASRRELARVRMWDEDYVPAREAFAAIVATGKARLEDYESLVQIGLWSGDLEAAEPYAHKLVELSPGNASAQSLIALLGEQRMIAALEQGQALEAAHQFREASDIYGRYLESYGERQEFRLRRCRLANWAGDLGEAIERYRDYLSRYPDDNEARVELGQCLAWSDRWNEAEAAYRAVLAKDANSAAAWLGLGERLAREGGEPFEAVRAYRHGLSLQPANVQARAQLVALQYAIAPVVGVDEDLFTDSDDLIRSRTTLAARFASPYKLAVSVYAALGRFRQQRTLPGDTLPIQALNARIASRGGKLQSYALGLKLETTARQHGFAALEAAVTRSALGRVDVEGRALFVLRPSVDQELQAEYVRREAIYDVATLATLAAGVVGDAATLTYDKSWRKRWRVWTQAGLTHFSAGRDPGFTTDLQRRLSVRADVRLYRTLTVGYALRTTGFSRNSPLYFSPGNYTTYSAFLAYELRRGERLHARFDAEAGRATIDGARSMEWMLAGGLDVRWHPRLLLRADGRISRSHAGFFGAAFYESRMVSVSLARTF